MNFFKFGPVEPEEKLNIFIFLFLVQGAIQFEESYF